jgi:NAD(P)-dependent dehydrogenase (short-subunit alcohol dehydrogenase family)
MIPRSAFVVGGSGGLGSAICRRLAPDWDFVGIGYRKSLQPASVLAEALAPQCQAIPVRCDLLDTESVEAAVAGFAAQAGGIGTMLFAGGVAIGQPYVSKVPESAWREVLETELLGFIRIVAATLPIFRQQNGGNFVSIVSVATTHFPQGDALSAVPKAGIEMLGRALAKEEGRFGIRANMVAPGIIDSGLGASFLQTLYTPEIWEAQRKRIALRRFGDAAEVAEAAAFLASEAARYITGQTLIVDGGFSL